ncbi:ABC transporter substrate-binding protein [Paenibacillus thiaminolyticus]|uniref:ABC transporter substrate-binding protein n=1 Tax=Paenibacillus thiaminolyticus TaxID=49283 RepID=UPI0011651547|nr:ABC transporter substrate-binding protein [Paenibacillus thiaminolyticus]NGP60218.1 ABC transporter substrate-binding protein [Paenibacillus thiaminolyticus]WCR26140.1 ABC transporter substrate-binding protein [Paenibacillus thiaminolyticus]
MAKAKKLLLMTFCLVLVASLALAGCGSKKEEAGGAEAGTSEKPVELVWYSIGPPQKDLDKVMEKVSEYTKEKIGVTVKMKMFDWGDYNQKMGVIAASGEPFDIAFTSSWAFEYVANAKKGAFYELDDLMDQYGQDIKKLVHPSFLEGAKIDGKTYAIPVNKELPAQKVFRFNKGLVDKYDLDINSVKTLEDLEPLLAKVKEGESGLYPLSADKQFKFAVPYDLVNENLPLGVALTDTNDLKIVNILEQPDMMKGFETMHDYYKKGYLKKDAATASGGDEMKTGKWLVDMPDTQPFADNLWSQSLGYPVESVPYTEPYVYNWSVMGSMHAISANSPHPEKAMQFLNLLNSDRYLRNLVNNGIEDVHYKRIDDETVEYLPAKTEAYDMATFTLGNFFILDKLPADPKDKWEQFAQFNDNAKNAPLLGFHFNADSVKTEMTALTNVKDEFYASLFTGSVDPKVYVPKAVEKFKAAGLDKVQAEMEKQLEEWKASRK